MQLTGWWLFGLTLHFLWGNGSCHSSQLLWAQFGWDAPERFLLEVGRGGERQAASSWSIKQQQLLWHLVPFKNPFAAAVLTGEVSSEWQQTHSSGPLHWPDFFFFKKNTSHIILREIRMSNSNQKGQLQEEKFKLQSFLEEIQDINRRKEGTLSCFFY